jgi:hypothetical protein
MMELAMKRRRWMLALALTAACTASVTAQDLKSPNADNYVPRLGDIMNTATMRHQILSLAAKARNWELAAYELRQLKSSLVEAALLYSGIPVSNVTTLKAPLQSVSDAIEARDSRAFAKAMADVTEGCNACHRAMNRGFLVMRVPADQRPFGNLVFPPGKP